MSSELNIGKILDSNPGRDAIHVAIAPVIAIQELQPGQRIGLVDGESKAGVTSRPLGIVDPYLTESVKFGQMFYMFLFPQTVTSLRHVWTHPGFAKEEK